MTELAMRVIWCSLALVLLCCRPQNDEKYAFREPQAIGALSLASLPALDACGNSPLDLSSFSIVAYLPVNSCFSCVTRELESLKQLKASNSGLNIVFIVHPELPLLDELRKTKLLHCPILVDDSGMSHMGSRFRISLLDVLNNQILVSYFPAPGSYNDWKVFENHVVSMLGRQERNPGARR